MGNRLFANKSKISPLYETHLINNLNSNLNSNANPNANQIPLIPHNNILENMTKFNTEQYIVYETYFITSQIKISKTINNWLTSTRSNNDVFDYLFTTNCINKYIPVKYISTKISTIYMFKLLDFICETYTDINVTILTNTDKCILFRISSHSPNNYKPTPRTI